MSHGDAYRKGQFTFIFFFNETFECVKQQLGKSTLLLRCSLLVAEISKMPNELKLETDNKRSSQSLAQIEPSYWILTAGGAEEEETSSATWVEIFGQTL